MTYTYPLSLWHEQKIPLHQFHVKGIYDGVLHRGRCAKILSNRMPGTLADLVSWCFECYPLDMLSAASLDNSPAAVENLHTLGCCSVASRALSHDRVTYDSFNAYPYLSNLLYARGYVREPSEEAALKAWGEALRSEIDTKIDELRQWARGVGRTDMLNALAVGMLEVQREALKTNSSTDRFLVRVHPDIHHNGGSTNNNFRLLVDFGAGTVVDDSIRQLLYYRGLLDECVQLDNSDTDDIVEEAIRLMTDGGEYELPYAALSAARAL